MRLIDLSQPLFDGSPNCPLDPPVRSELLIDHDPDGWRVEKLTLTSHSGSHVDAPLHKIAGAASLDDLPLDRFAGDAFIADLRGIAPSTPIGPELLAPRLTLPLDDRIVLLATGWGQKRARSDEWLYRSPFLSQAGARWLAGRKVRGVGIDHYSIAGIHAPVNAEVHEILLSAGVWVVEELRFPDEAFAVQRPCRFWALPVNLRGHTGAFCRPVIEAV